MTLEEQLKRKILERYKSVRAFTSAIGVSYSTVDSALKREHGIKNAGIVTMLKIFDALGLDIESVAEGTLRNKGEPSAPSITPAETVSPKLAPEESLTADMEELLQTLTPKQAALLCKIASRCLEHVKATAKL